jgi:hypothetical protein
MMALINCFECKEQVSDQAIKCPKCGFQIKKIKRGFLGKLFKFLFIIFNLFMLVWLISYFNSIGEIVSDSNNKAEHVGATIGATLGTGFLVTVWALGDIILGLFVLLTRPK